MFGLSNFPEPPAFECVTICEKRGELVSAEISDGHLKEGLCFPDINFASEHLKSCRARESRVESAFLEDKDSLKLQLFRAWNKHGFTGILVELSSSRQEKCSTGQRLISQSASFILSVLRFIRSPHLAMSTEDLIAEFSSVGNWREGHVRCLAWHPHVAKFAVATKDDEVSIRSYRPCEDARSLKHNSQRGVADLAWNPFSASVLAVACESCILIWNIDPTSVAMRPSAYSVHTLSHPGHCPVISLAWCPQGSTLVSASAMDNSIMVWNADTKSSQPIKRFESGGLTLLRWSPDGSKLLTACSTPSFRVWECTTWTNDVWTKLNGRCQAACWSPDGNTLLFATSEDPVIYGLEFRKCDASTSLLLAKTTAVPVISLATMELMNDDRKICVGGLLQSMAWDPHGERLAVLFKGPAAAHVALFQTRCFPNFEAIPIGFIRGLADEVATIISFKSKFEEGSLLSVVWSSGRLSHIPLFYCPRSSIGKTNEFMRSDDQLKTFYSQNLNSSSS